MPLKESLAEPNVAKINRETNTKKTLTWVYRPRGTLKSVSSHFSPACSPPSIDVNSYQTHVHSGQLMYTQINSCTLKSTHVHSNQLIYTQINSCTLKSTHVHSGQLMYTQVNSCTLRSTHVRSWKLMSIHAHSCPFTSIRVNSIYEAGSREGEPPPSTDKAYSPTWPNRRIIFISIYRHMNNRFFEGSSWKLPGARIDKLGLRTNSSNPPALGR